MSARCDHPRRDDDDDNAMVRTGRPTVLDLALPPPDLDLVVDPAAVVLSAHAVRRYRERVEGVPRRLVARRLCELVAAARWRSRPRAWTEVVLHPGVIYGYAESRPDVCLLLRQNVLVTVLSQRHLRQTARRRTAYRVPSATPPRWFYRNDVARVGPHPGSTRTVPVACCCSVVPGSLPTCAARLE